MYFKNKSISWSNLVEETWFLIRILNINFLLSLSSFCKIIISYPFSTMIHWNVKKWSEGQETQHCEKKHYMYV